MPFTYSAEAFPLYIRDIGMSYATALTWLLYVYAVRSRFQLKRPIGPRSTQQLCRRHYVPASIRSVQTSGCVRVVRGVEHCGILCHLALCARDQGAVTRGTEPG